MASSCDETETIFYEPGFNGLTIFTWVEVNFCLLLNTLMYIIGERAKRARHSQVCTIENRGYIMVRAISVYSAGVQYAARFTAAVKIPLPLATFQF